MSKKNEELATLDLMDIYQLYAEDFIESPTQHLTDLCQFLNVSIDGQQFPETRKSQYSSGVPTCAFVNCHVKIGLS